MSLGIVAAQDNFPYTAIQFPEELTPRLSARWLASYWVMPFEAQPQMMSLGPFAWHASDFWSNGRTAHFFLRESWSETLFAPPLTKGKWLAKVTCSFFKELLQQLQGNLNRPWMYLEGEDSFHSHLWMLSRGNDLSKSRTFSSLFYSPERNTPFTQRYESRTFCSLFILWVFLSCLSLFMLFSPLSYLF